MLRGNIAATSLKMLLKNLYSVKCYDKLNMNVLTLSLWENFWWGLIYFDQFIMWVIRAGNHKMVVRIANRQGSDQILFRIQHGFARTKWRVGAAGVPWGLDSQNTPPSSSIIITFQRQMGYCFGIIHQPSSIYLSVHPSKAGGDPGFLKGGSYV